MVAVQRLVSRGRGQEVLPGLHGGWTRLILILSYV